MGSSFEYLNCTRNLITVIEVSALHVTGWGQATVD